VFSLTSSTSQGQERRRALPLRGASFEPDRTDDRQREVDPLADTDALADMGLHCGAAFVISSVRPNAPRLTMTNLEFAPLEQLA